MKNNLFIVVLNYTAPLDKVDMHKEMHVQFLDRYYSKGILIASGPQVPRTGGIIIAKCPSKTDLENILKEDPFAIHGLAEYKIYEFTPTKHAASFNIGTPYETD